MFKEHHIKQRPLLGLSGLGGGTGRFGGPSSPGILIEYAVIAGGGGGAGELSGGGGAGGMRVDTYEVSLGTPYPIVVGGAGSYALGGGGGSPSALYYYGTPGGPSSFADITSTGGGGGGGYFGDPTSPQGDFGGSGGGGAGSLGYGINPTTPTTFGGPYTRTEGYPGGSANNYGAGGGGGAGSAGQSHLSGTGPSPPAGNGGDGAPVNWPEIPASYGVSGPSPGRWFAGGGGGGGGAPGWTRAYPGSPGIAGYTYGAGGQGQGSPGSVGSPGYAGIVMLRFPISRSYSQTNQASMSTSPTHRVIIWTGPGSITFS